MGQKSGSTTTSIPALSEEQKQMIATQNKFFQEDIAPAYREYMKGSIAQFNQDAPGITNAAQNVAGTAGQVQQVAGSLGESGARAGMTAAQDLFRPDYEKRQLEAAFVPAQMQYQKNLADQVAQYGAAGQLGSARSALAQTALAGQTQAAQQAAAAQIEKDIAMNRLQAAGLLTGSGKDFLTQALGASQAGQQAAYSGLDTFSRLGGLFGQTPQSTYIPNFAGTQGGTTNKQGYQVNFSMPNLQ